MLMWREDVTETLRFSILACMKLRHQSDICSSIVANSRICSYAGLPSLLMTIDKCVIVNAALSWFFRTDIYDMLTRGVKPRRGFELTACSVSTEIDLCDAGLWDMWESLCQHFYRWSYFFLCSQQRLNEVSIMWNSTLIKMLVRVSFNPSVVITMKVILEQLFSRSRRRILISVNKGAVFQHWLKKYADLRIVLTYGLKPVYM